MDTIKCSEVRKKAMRKVIHDILFYSKKKLSDRTLTKIVECLSQYEVEKGVSVFMTAERPNAYDTKLIGKIDTGKEILYLWWTKNVKKNAQGHGNTYALGMNFGYKTAGELAIYTMEDWENEFPEFAMYLSELRGKIWKVKLFSKASVFYKEVAELPGDWLVQTPVNKSFVPNRPIGKLVAPDKLYIFQPNPKMKKDFYERLIKIE